MVGGRGFWNVEERNARPPGSSHSPDLKQKCSVASLSLAKILLPSSDTVQGITMTLQRAVPVLP